MNTTAHVLAAAVAPHLPGWSVAPQDMDRHGAELVRMADGARIHVTVGGYRMDGRAVFSGGWPRFRDGRTYWPRERCEITCSASRSPASIARDVARRMLPAYDVVYARALAYVQHEDAAQDEAHAVAARLAPIVGGEVEPATRRWQREDGAAIRGAALPESIDKLIVRQAYEGLTARPVRVDLHVSGLDPETAAAVLQLIADSEQSRVATEVRVAEEQDGEELEALLEASVAMARGARRVANGGGR